ncbi:MAG TPA: fluoride efflux transporter CrcB [Candidatus Acidoferrales bacterium]
MKYLMVALGGALGSVLRFAVGSYAADRIGTRFPYGTFAVNITGSFLIGLIVTLITERANVNPNWRYLIPIGFIGGYTTFSAFEYETFRSMQDGKFLIASLNVVLSVALGLLAVWLGVAAARTID